jgi:hypothetical protein
MAFLRRANGGEGFIGEPYVRLWRAEELIEVNRDYNLANQTKKTARRSRGSQAGQGTNMALLSDLSLLLDAALVGQLTTLLGHSEVGCAGRCASWSCDRDLSGFRASGD